MIINLADPICNVIQCGCSKEVLIVIPSLKSQALKKLYFGHQELAIDTFLRIVFTVYKPEICSGIYSFEIMANSPYENLMKIYLDWNQENVPLIDENGLKTGFYTYFWKNKEEIEYV